MIGLTKRTVKLVEYSESWNEEYEKEVACLKSILNISNKKEDEKSILEGDDISNSKGNSDIIFEHVGSTSIKGMKAKPIIDVLIGFRKASNLRNAKKVLIKAEEYNYVPQINIPNLVLLTKSTKDNTDIVTHHILLTKLGSEKWTDMVLFRNYLRRNKKVANSYNLLKEKLSKAFSEDRIGYSKAKKKFIETITVRATTLQRIKKNQRRFNSLNKRKITTEQYEIYMNLNSFR